MSAPRRLMSEDDLAREDVLIQVGYERVSLQREKIRDADEALNAEMDSLEERRIAWRHARDALGSLAGRFIRGGPGSVPLLKFPDSSLHASRRSSLVEGQDIEETLELPHHHPESLEEEIRFELETPNPVEVGRVGVEACLLDPLPELGDIGPYRDQVDNDGPDLVITRKPSGHADEPGIRPFERHRKIAALIGYKPIRVEGNSPGIVCPICSESVAAVDPVQSYGGSVAHADCARLMRYAVPWAERLPP